MNKMLSFFDNLGSTVMKSVEEAGSILLMCIDVLKWMVKPPLKLDLVVKQMEFVGVKSLFVVVLTGTFTGMVMALQGYYGFKMFNAESMVGSTVALGITRELGPVLTALMVTARAGSAMAAELGTMRVTEQIDAYYVMSANPVKYLIVPRIVAAVLMLPALTIIADFMGILGGYFVGVPILHINAGAFVQNIVTIVGLDDIYNGLIKSAFFGLILSVAGCYKGFTMTGGAEGVGKATTEAVVLASVSILVSDYFLTAIMF